MKSIAWLFKCLLKAAIFFTLFAFALNNQGDVTVRFFFGRQWTAPMVLVVLAAFACGLLMGVLGMVPRWWKQRRFAISARQQAAQQAGPTDGTPAQEPAYPLTPPHGV